MQNPKSSRSVEVGFSPLRSTFSHAFPQSEHVVEEPHSLEEGTLVVVVIAHRCTHLRPPPNPTARGITHTSDPNSISPGPPLGTSVYPYRCSRPWECSSDLSKSSWSEPTSPTVALVVRAVVARGRYEFLFFFVRFA